VALAVTAIPATSRATEFLRGDANSDGVVTFADAHFMLTHVFRRGLTVECEKALDADGSGIVTLSDGIVLVYATTFGDSLIPAPFPEPGEEPPGSETSLSCDGWGGGEPIADPSATIAVGEARVAGGNDSTFTLVIEAASSTSFAGIYTRVVFPSGSIAHVEKTSADRTGIYDNGFSSARAQGDRIDIGHMASIVEETPIPAGSLSEVVEVTGCIATPLEAGEYPITVELGEIVDWDTGRRIDPTFVDGILIVESDISPTATCAVGSGGDPGPDPTPPNVEFALADVTAVGVDPVVPLTIWSDAGVQAFLFSIDFDEEVLNVTGIEPLVGNPGEGFQAYYFDNSNNTPGNAGVDEGYITGAHILHLTMPVALPVNTEVEVARFAFEVLDGVGETTTELEFVDGGQDPHAGGPTNNRVTIGGTPLTPDALPSFILIGATLHVLPDVTIFIRGDTNGDEQIDISDAQSALGYLFLGSTRPVCLDAVDVNDDGELNVTDPVALLSYLFLGAEPPAAPFPNSGEDPTIDRITCHFILP